jgi:hypothetical protein
MTAVYGRSGRLMAVRGALRPRAVENHALRPVVPLGAPHLGGPVRPTSAAAPPPPPLPPEPARPARQACAAAAATPEAPRQTERHVYLLMRLVDDFFYVTTDMAAAGRFVRPPTSPQLGPHDC